MRYSFLCGGIGCQATGALISPIGTTYSYRDSTRLALRPDFASHRFFTPRSPRTSIMESRAAISVLRLGVRPARTCQAMISKQPRMQGMWRQQQMMTISFDFNFTNPWRASHHIVTNGSAKDHCRFSRPSVNSAFFVSALL